MLRFTKRADYGLMAIHYIAVNDRVRAVSAKRIAEEFTIPPELMAKILQRLAKQGLIVSTNGPKGGYALARRPTEITVGQVIRALEGPINIVSCLEDADCPQMEKCNLRRPVQKIQAAISQVLDTMSLAELTSADVPELLSIRT
jgi:Rrf2 family protein